MAGTEPHAWAVFECLRLSGPSTANRPALLSNSIVLRPFLYRNTLTVFGFRNTRDTLKRAQGRVDRLANQLRDGNRSPRAYFGHGDAIRPQFSHRNTGEVRLNPFAVYRYHPLDFFNDEADCLAIIIQIAVRERLISRP